jgi:hypothetical protein
MAVIHVAPFRKHDAWFFFSYHNADVPMTLNPDELNVDSFDTEPETADVPSLGDAENKAYQVPESFDGVCSPWCVQSADNPCYMY